MEDALVHVILTIVQGFLKACASVIFSQSEMSLQHAAGGLIRSVHALKGQTDAEACCRIGS